MEETALPDRIETPRLTLRKSRFEDWRDLYTNIWSRPESARHMLWSVTTSESDARARMERTLAWEKTHPGKYSVEEKASGAVIGWAGIERLSDRVWGETGVALGPDYWRRGYGREIVTALTDFCRDECGAKVFVYSAREANAASRALAESCGFTLDSSELRTDEDGRAYLLLLYRKALS